MAAALTEDYAAQKIQAIQRGRMGRKEADRKRAAQQAAESAAESESAKKIQALQRGRMARRVAQERKEHHSGAFNRPFVKETSEEAIMTVNKQAAGDTFGSFAKLAAAVQGEFPAHKVDESQVYYSTKDAPMCFGNRLSQELLEKAQHVLDLQLLVAKAKTALREAEAKTVDPNHPEGKAKSKTELANEEKTLAREQNQRKNEVNTAVYNADVATAKLANYHKLHSLKVVFL